MDALPEDRDETYAPTLSRPATIVETTDEYSFIAAAKALEKRGISFQAEKEYTADLVEGRSFLSPFIWKIIVEEEQRQEACRLIENVGCNVIFEDSDEEEPIDDEPVDKERRFWLLFIYGGLLLISLVILLKRLMD